MQEEVTQKSIALVIRTSKLTADVLKKAMLAYLNHLKNKQNNWHGKISVRKLMGKDQGANTMEITENNIKSFERVAKKYNVDFAVKKDKTVDPPKNMALQFCYDLLLPFSRNAVHTFTIL